MQLFEEETQITNIASVERRRRETINEGINELAKIVPGCEKNKGSILARAVTYINDLKKREEGTSSNRTLEMSVLEQAVSELSTRNEQLQHDLKEWQDDNERLQKENESLKEKIRQLGGTVDEEDDAKRK